MPAGNRVLITGVSGFVGQAALQAFLSAGHIVRGTVRSSGQASALSREFPPEAGNPEFVPIGDIAEYPGWAPILEGIDVVVHLAGCTHVHGFSEQEISSTYRRINVTGTERLAAAAAKAGVKRFVFMSSIGVNGNGSSLAPYTASDIPRPHDSYSVSKYEAEEALRKISNNTGLDVVTIRSPLIYGPHNRGNFLRLLRMVWLGFPMPLASIDNKRSMIYLGNLVDVLLLCSVHPKAKGRIYLVCDGEDISTPDLIRRMGQLLKKPAKLFPFPVSVIKAVARLAGKSAMTDRLCNSLIIDGSGVRDDFGWSPPYSLSRGLGETAGWFRSKMNSEIS